MYHIVVAQCPSISNWKGERMDD